MALDAAEAPSRRRRIIGRTPRRFNADNASQQRGNRHTQRRLLNVRKDAVEFVEAVVGHDQLAAPFDRVLDLHLGA